MTLKPRVAWQVQALLGEGPVWIDSEQSLRFVDIKRGSLHRFDPQAGARESLLIGGQPSFVVPASDGSFIVGSEHGLFRFDGERLGAKIATIPQPVHNRTNDATVDSARRLWFGTMDDAELRPTGEVWCLDGGKLRCVAGANAVVTNGPAVSSDGTLLYHVDSARRSVWRFPLTEQACLAEGEVIITIREEDGFPDGVVLDSEDCLWVALWDGWAVRRYAPDGTLLLHIPFPCARVTKLAFGGADLRTAFITTARIGLSAEDLAKQPMAGSLFAFDTSVAGRPGCSVLLP